jgi:hypothetical protein
MFKAILLLFALLLCPMASAQTIQYKGVLLLYPIGASPTDSPIKTTGWAQIYSVPPYATPDQAYARCKGDAELKAAELNVIYANAKETSRWVGACVRAQ